MTYHSIIRAESRARMNMDEAIEFIQEAIEKGKGAERLPDMEKEYINGKSREGYRILFFKGFLFVITDANVCVTMYKAPEWFLKNKNRYDGKNRIKNVKRYNKYYGYQEKGRTVDEDFLWS